jgi:hypothetical protein
VIFTIDNRVESLLVSVEVQSLIEKFSKIASVVVRLAGALNPTKYFSIGVIMWQPLLEFYKWFSKAFSTTTIPAIRFELIDVHWQPEKVFIVPEGHLEYFRLLKQYIWDLFWMASNLMPGDNAFRVLIMPVTRLLAPGKEVSFRWNSVKALPALEPTQESVENSALVPERRVFFTSQKEMEPIPIHVPPSANGNSGSLAVPRRSINMASSSYVTTPFNQTRNTSPKDRPKETPIATRNSNPRPVQKLNGASVPAGLFKRPPRDDVIKECLKNEAQTIVSSIRSLHIFIHLIFPALISNRAELVLEPAESTPSRGDITYREYPHVRGGLVDMNSGYGTVRISEPGKEERKIMTSYKQPFQRNEYTHFTLGPGQSVKVFGEAVVLFYRLRRIAPPTPTIPQAQPWNTPAPANVPAQLQPHVPSPTVEANSFQSPTFPATRICSSTPEILIRLQTSSSGHFSTPYPKSCIRPKITTEEFFAWFAHQTSHCLPHGPERLRFTFKDAMPVPHSSDIGRGNEEHFMFMRRDIRRMSEKAGKWMGGLREFGVLVSVPGWSEGNGENGEGEEEDEW